MRNYLLEEDELLLCELRVFDALTTTYQESEQYLLILRWNGRALTCAIFRESDWTHVKVDFFLEKLEGPRSNLAPGPSRDTDIRVLITKEVISSSLLPSEPPLMFRVDLRCEKLEGLQNNPPCVPSEDNARGNGRAGRLLRDIAGRSR